MHANLVNLGDRTAISLAIDVLAVNPPIDRIHDRDGYEYIARAVTQRDEFWYILIKKNNTKKKTVVNYLDKNRDLYSGSEGFLFMKKYILFFFLIPFPYDCLFYYHKYINKLSYIWTYSWFNNILIVCWLYKIEILSRRLNNSNNNN